MADQCAAPVPQLSLFISRDELYLMPLVEKCLDFLATISIVISKTVFCKSPPLKTDQLWISVRITKALYPAPHSPNVNCEKENHCAKTLYQSCNEPIFVVAGSVQFSSTGEIFHCICFDMCQGPQCEYEAAALVDLQPHTSKWVHFICTAVFTDKITKCLTVENKMSYIHQD